jgi:transcriptional regulator with XRE-family HTH domain
MIDTKGKSDVSASFLSLQLNESMKEPLGTYCAERRKNLNLTQAQVAETLGYTVQAISKFENGHTEMSLSSLTMLAKLLSLSLDDLLHQRENPAEPPSNGIFVTDNLANNLTYLRKKNGLTMEAVAEKTTISERALLNYESGQSLPFPSVFLALADLYQVNCDSLLNEKMAPDLVTPLAPKKKTRIKPFAIVTIAVMVAVGVSVGATAPLWAQKGQSGSSSSATHETSSSSSTGSLSSSSSSRPTGSDPELDGVTIDGLINGTTVATLSPGNYKLSISITTSWWSTEKYSRIKWEIDVGSSTDPTGATFSYDTTNYGWSLVVKNTASDKGIFSFHPYILSEKGPAYDLHSENSVKITFSNPATDYTPTSDFIADLKSFTVSISGYTEIYLAPGVYNVSCVFSPADWGVKNEGKFRYLYNPQGGYSTRIGFGLDGIYVYDGATEADSATFYVHVSNISNTSEYKMSVNTITIHCKSA